MILYPISDSPSALERAFDVSGTTDILGVPAWIVLRKDKTAAAIVYAEPSLDGEASFVISLQQNWI
ncbi:hypothetical protein [Buttiauxella agrestis]|nr:hypothetical protein [Buttiauxella agrestis]